MAITPALLYAFKLGINQAVNKSVHAFVIGLCNSLYYFFSPLRYG